VVAEEIIMAHQLVVMVVQEEELIIHKGQVLRELAYLGKDIGVVMEIIPLLTMAMVLVVALVL
jgi:hypothetical protein